MEELQGVKLFMKQKKFVTLHIYNVETALDDENTMLTQGETYDTV